MQRVTRLTAPARGARSMPHARLLSMSASRSQQDKKDDLMDKDSINTTSTEYSKSGGGDAGAAQTDHAFDPSSTSPEGQTSSEQAKDGDKSSVNISPGNHDVSNSHAAKRQGNRTEGSPNQEQGGRKSSGGGNSNKAG